MPFLGRKATIARPKTECNLLPQLEELVHSKQKVSLTSSINVLAPLLNYSSKDSFQYTNLNFFSTFLVLLQKKLHLTMNSSIFLKPNRFYSFTNNIQEKLKNLLKLEGFVISTQDLQSSQEQKRRLIIFIGTLLSILSLMFFTNDIFVQEILPFSLTDNIGLRNSSPEAVAWLGILLAIQETI